MEEVFDSLYLLRSDTTTNTEIYYHEVVKLIERDGNWVDIYVPIFIAVLALGFSGWQFYVARRDRRIQIKPLVNLNRSYNNDNFGVKLNNQGLGAANIIKIEYSFKNTKSPRLKEIIHNLISVQNRNIYYSAEGSYFNNYLKEFYIKSSELKPLVNFVYNNKTQKKNFIKELKKIRIKVTFCDMYGKHKTTIDEPLYHIE